MFLLDTHIDTPSVLLEEIDLGQRQPRWHVDIPRMKEGGVNGAFFAIYIPKEMTETQAVGHAVNLISKVYDMVDSNKDSAAFAFSAQDAFRNQENGLISVFMGLENGIPIGQDLKMLHFFHRMGIRYVTLCHNADNQICDSAASSAPKWGGLSPFGREAVREMNRIGMLIDISHTSDDTFYDVLKYSEKPVVASHSSCRALCPHKRNLSDGMIRDLASQGGVIQINFYPFFLQDGLHNREIDTLIEDMEHWQNRFREDLKDEVARDKYYSILEKLKDYPSVSYKLIADHIDYVVSLVGTDHVGLGSDFDGIEITPEGMKDASCFPVLIDELKARGYSGTDIEKIAGGNFLRLL